MAALLILLACVAGVAAQMKFENKYTEDAEYFIGTGGNISLWNAGSIIFGGAWILFWIGLLILIKNKKFSLQVKRA